MDNQLPKHLTAACMPCILVLLTLSLQSCEDQSVNLDRSKLQFTISPQGRNTDIDFPENARLRISIKNKSGTTILSDHEMKLLNADHNYKSGPLELLPGSYTITDFMIIYDSEVLTAVPRSGSQLGAAVEQSLPYSFTVAESGLTNVSIQVLNTRNAKPEAFGYASFKMNSINKLSFIVFKPSGTTSLKGATAELRLGKYLVKKISVKPGMNTMTFEGNPDAVYALAVLAGETAKVKTFNFKELKKDLCGRPFKITLEPALLITMESIVEEEEEYITYYHFSMEGTGAVTINWGDGYEESTSLPFDGEHVYTIGRYTAIVTGDVDQITNFRGFGYGTTMYSITGLTNLTALKTYSPSWGSVPLKVNLSNCENLETIRIEMSASGEPVNLATDFQLPQKHFINNFYFDADLYVGAEALEVFADNIYNNARLRFIYGGRFFVHPVDTPLFQTQEKLDILESDYGWDVRLDETIWDMLLVGSKAEGPEKISSTNHYP